MDAARGPRASVVVRPAPRHRVGARGGGRYTLRRRIRLVAYGARLEIVLGVKALAGSNPASSASCQTERRSLKSRGAGASHVLARSAPRGRRAERLEGVDPALAAAEVVFRVI
jgi:hypothetical protein